MLAFSKSADWPAAYPRFSSTDVHCMDSVKETISPIFPPWKAVFMQTGVSSALTDITAWKQLICLSHKLLPLFEKWNGSNLLPDMYNVNIKWGNSAHFLSLLLHTLVTQRERSYTIHFCRGREKKEEASFLLWEWERQTPKVTGARWVVWKWKLQE